MSEIPFNGIKCLDDGFVGLVDHMGDDSAIVQAARISYGKDERRPKVTSPCCFDGHYSLIFKGREYAECTTCGNVFDIFGDKQPLPNIPNKADTRLIRYLMRHRHTTPFEMVEFKFIIRIPMDAWRQMIRHRTASVNEYSTRYSEAIDSCQTTDPKEWRLQSKSNKQGSTGYLPASYLADSTGEVVSLTTDGQSLSAQEQAFQKEAQALYQRRIKAGVAREQARKDLPLSTYTEAYWKIDLHNLFHFLSLRLDSHAQLEIRTYAKAIFELIKPIVPIAVQAFEDYRLNGAFFSAAEMNWIKNMVLDSGYDDAAFIDSTGQMSDREIKEFKEKLQ